MEILSELQIAFRAFAAGDEQARDLAAEELSDLLEDAGSMQCADVQRVVAVLAGALAVEKSTIVIESILNALAKAKYHARLPLEQIKDLRVTLYGGALEHAEYLLDS